MVLIYLPWLRRANNLAFRIRKNYFSKYYGYSFIWSFIPFHLYWVGGFDSRHVGSVLVCRVRGFNVLEGIYILPTLGSYPIYSLFKSSHCMLWFRKILLRWPKICHTDKFFAPYQGNRYHLSIFSNPRIRRYSNSRDLYNYRYA